MTPITPETVAKLKRLEAKAVSPDNEFEDSEAFSFCLHDNFAALIAAAEENVRLRARLDAVTQAVSEAASEAADLAEREKYAPLDRNHPDYKHRSDPHFDSFDYGWMTCAKAVKAAAMEDK